MPTWLALVRKTKLKGTEDFADIVCVDAPTKEEAITQISQYVWPESWWTDRSRLQILKIFDMNDLPSWVTIPGVEPVKRRRRVRYA